jgi:hypothetical protein
MRKGRARALPFDACRCWHQAVIVTRVMMAEETRPSLV